MRAKQANARATRDAIQDRIGPRLKPRYHTIVVPTEPWSPKSSSTGERCSWASSTCRVDDDRQI